MEQFGTIMFTPAVAREQQARGSRGTCEWMSQRLVPVGLGADERAFIETRNSAYLATVSETGWPYVQHRGGPRGFLKVLGPDRIGFADYRGNQQYVSTGNLLGNDRVSLLLMDYFRKARLKILGHARVTDAADDPDTAARLTTDGEGRVERLFLVDVVAFDWNCPKFITPRLDTDEMAATIGPELSRLEGRVAELEAELTALRAQQGSNL